MAHLIYSRIASSTPHRLQVYWVDLNPLSDWFPSNLPPDWHIYILYSGIPYTCVIYLYTTSLHFTATPSALAPRGIYFRIMPVGAVTPNFPLRVLHSSLTVLRTLHYLSFRISHFLFRSVVHQRNLAMVFWLLLPLFPVSVHKWVLLLVVGRRGFVGIASIH